MSRKAYPSDKNTTTVRVSKPLHRLVKAAAKKDNRTVEGYVGIALNAAVAPKI